MRVEKAKVRAPEIGRIWLNSPALTLRQLRGQAVLIDFWDYTCVNCIRTLPYVQGWHERYGNKGLAVIGVHTPEFTFAQYESNVERGIREFGLTYPIVIDNNYELWKAFANRCWPTKYLLDGEGYLRFAQFGEGAYAEFEEAIQELLREIAPGVALPPIMQPVRAEDRPGATCYPPSPELYLGHKRGRIGNHGGFREDSVFEYQFSGSPEENVAYIHGHWGSTAEYLESVGDAGHSLRLKYSAAAVNLVMAAPREGSREVQIRQDGKPLSREQATPDIRFRTSNEQQESFVVVQQPRMYSLVDNHDFGNHELELLCPGGVAVFAFTFTSCINPALVPDGARQPV
ncbi:MAG TPA: redoxin domain-containing protein [Terriglobales bacterium]|nr:redoxin domain-containing protein [Terriglobales bacterium]